MDVEFGFKTQDELVKALQRAHLYVHAANIEIEAIACIEAIAAGLVPVIANAKRVLLLNLQSMNSISLNQMMIMI